MATGFFPLDAELDLPPVCLLPHAHQALVRLGALLPFAQATEQLCALLDIRISTSTVRQHTEQAGRGSLAVQNEQAKPLAVCREETPGERMVMSADGAFVPLVGGQWGEVKLLAIGQVEVQEAVTAQSLPCTSTTQVSYFARLTDVSTFSEQASAEIRRRGLDRAKAVCAVQDGAEWLVGLTHSHRHDALRILDFAHAAQRIAAVRDLFVATGRLVEENWLESLLHQLKHEGPDLVVQEIERMYQDAGKPEAMGEHVRYVRKRMANMQYPAFQKAGWPIGSGMVESGNKLVMQARLKGAGMHWKPEQVNPMLALRMNLCNERWNEGWSDQLRWNEQVRSAGRKRKQQHRWTQRQSPQLHQDIPVVTVAAKPEPSPNPSTGRTQGQYRWGRQTFSPRMLRQGGLAKK